MASDREKDRTELRKEIKIAIFWRQLIGDFEYIKFNPDDMLRWYLAMDMRGKYEVRDLIDERYPIGARRAPVHGLVGEAPHPPAWIVRAWLDMQQPKFPKWRVFFMSCCFVVITGMLAPIMYGCQALVTAPPSGRMIASQPNTTPPASTKYAVSIPQASTPVLVQPMSTVPAPASAVLPNGTSPPVSQVQMGVPLSARAAPSTGQTGPLNGGLSGPPPTSTGAGGSSAAPP